MVFSLLSSLFNRRRAFVWQPALTLTDSEIVCALIPHGNH
jgi:hypothetical protein